jgi:hypothetical protein
MRNNMDGWTFSLAPLWFSDLHRILITNLHMLIFFASLILRKDGYSLGLMPTPLVGASTEHIPYATKNLKNFKLADLMFANLASRDATVGCFFPF